MENEQKAAWVTPEVNEEQEVRIMNGITADIDGDNGDDYGGSGPN